jgi:outer membrane protein OmpA-like peptidoglycan-associated protein
LKKTENKQANEGTLNKITNTFTSSTVEKKDSKPVSISLYKKDGLIVMDGVFASPEENKVIFNILNINRDGVYSYDENIVADQNLISKIAILIPAFKEFFEDNSSIIVKNNEVFLTGALKDSTHSVLLENTILKSSLKLIKDVKVPEPILIVKEELKPELKPENNKSLSLNDIQAKINELVASNKISFERRSSTITVNSQATLIEISKILQEYNQVKIEIGGHTDSRGDNALNKQISQDRANSVKESLVSMGINKDRLTAVGYGEDFPIAKDDENGLSEINRRVEFKIKGE